MGRAGAHRLKLHCERVPEQAGTTYMPGWRCRALPGGQLAAAQMQKHKNHSGEVISVGVSHRPNCTWCTSRDLQV